MGDTSKNSGESEKQSERFSRNRGRGFGSKNRDAHFKHNDRRYYGSSKESGYQSSRSESRGNEFRDSNSGRRPYKRVWSNPQGDEKRKRLEVGNRLKEPDIGVTEFLGDHSGFSGLVKERYTDFHVNEISLDGEIAKLTNQIIPSEPEELEDLESLKKNVSDTILEQLQKLKEDASPVASIEIDVTDIDKEGRKSIHHVAAQLANIQSKTVDQCGKKVMIIMKNDKRANASGFSNDRRTKWRRSGGDYCYFSLHKANMDTMEALNRMAKILRINPNNFNYAGTKDRRAWTTQWVSLRKVNPAHILRAGRAIRGVYVGNFKFEKKPLRLGMLSGNRFRIALRNVTVPDEEIEKIMISLRDQGFINYYGLQRFGTIAAIPTHEIGKRLLQGKWLEAIELILKPRDGEQDRDLAEARKIYETTKDASKAYERIKNSARIEATLLRGLKTCTEKNPQGALDMIPKNTRLIYIHAYQSFVWNHMVSRRIKEFGIRPVVGDLVYEKDPEKSPEDNVESLNQDNAEDACLESDEVKPIKKEIEDENEMICEAEIKDVKEEPDEDMMENIIEARNDKVSIDDIKEEAETTETNENIDNKDSIDDIKEVTSATESGLNIEEKSDDNNTVEDKEEQEVDDDDGPSIKILTEEDLPNYTLADVIMPQPGWKVVYPPYAKPWFDEFLGKDDLTTDLRRKNKKYSLSGTYRNILQIPIDLSWKIMHYKEKHDDLILCDIDEMRDVTPPKDDPEGQRKALIIEMSLKASTYATMALREILRQDTSPQAQVAQSAAHDALLESNATDKAETSNSNDDTQTMKIIEESEKCDNVEDKMDVDPVPEESVKDEKLLTEPEEETQLELANNDVEMKEAGETTENNKS